MWRTFRKCLAWVIRTLPPHCPPSCRTCYPMDELDFYGGGPKDGDRERVEAGRHEWIVTAVRQSAFSSPWGSDDFRLGDVMDLATGEYHPHALMVVGRYVRTGIGMAWRPE